MKCKHCGAEINLDTTLICPACGSSYTREEAERYRMGVEHVTEITVGGAEEIRLCRLTQDHFDYGRLDFARDDCEELQRQFPRNYLGWFGEARCITNDFTIVDLNDERKTYVSSLIDRALRTANEGEKQIINAQWVPYLNKCRAAEDNRRLMKQREIEEEQRRRKQEEEERQRQEAERQRQEQERIEAERLYKEQQELKRKHATALGIIVEVIFVILMFVFQYMKFVDDSFGGFIGVNLVMLAVVLCVTLIYKSGNVKSGVFVPSYVNALFAISIVIFSASHVGGFVNGFLAIIFFGAIELGVAGLGFFIVKKILDIR